MSGPCLSSSVTDRPLRPATRRCLGGPLPRQQADRPRANPAATAEAVFTLAGPWGINPGFPGLSPATGHVTHVLLTRAPLETSKASFNGSSFDLHVLSTPPAFVLSQNQTLRKKQFGVCVNTYQIDHPTSLLTGRPGPRALPARSTQFSLFLSTQHSGARWHPIC